MKHIRVGFIGAGGNTRLRHLPGFADIEQVTLVAVANRTLTSSQRVAAEFGLGRTYADWRELVAATDLDAVCIGTWPNTHAEMTAAALAAGKHVLVEARMANSLSAAQLMLTAAQARPDLVAQIVPSPLTLEADAVVRSLVRSGELGELTRIRSVYTNSSTRDPQAALSWRMDERISGINTLALGICYEPMQRWFDGEAHVSSARAEVITGRRTDAEGHSHAIKIPERLEVMGRWGDAALEMKQSSVEPGPDSCTYDLIGSRARLHYDVSAGDITLQKNGGAAQSVEIPQRPHGGWQVEAQFIDSIRTGAPVTRTDFASGVRYMAFTDAVWRAWDR